MPNMNETQIHQELDEITDTTAFSLVAILGLLASLAGTFSIGYIHLIPLAIIGTLMGAFALITAKRFRINFFSKALGFLAVVIGASSVSWGLFERKLETDHGVEQAKKISELYLQSLSAKELDKVFYLVGFQFEGESPEQRTGVKMSELDRAKARLELDPAHQEIRTRKTTPKWVYAGLDGEFEGTVGYTYRLRYRDEAQTIPPEYWVYARKASGRYERKDTIHWYVDNLERVKK